MSDGQQHLDRQVIETLVHRHLTVIREHYLEHDTSRERVLEVLNSLAVTVATVIAGTGNDTEAAAFFATSLRAQMESLIAEGMEQEGAGHG